MAKITNSRSLRVVKEKRASTSASCARSPEPLTVDPAFTSTGACNSAITFIDGEKGILRYRGYPIEQLAEKSDFVEVAWLLLYGELPNTEQLTKFRAQLTYHSLIHEDMKKFFEGFPNNAHPMAMLSAMVASLSAVLSGD